MFRKLLLPTDGSDISIAAAEPAVALAKLIGASLHAVVVVEPYAFVGIGAVRVEGFDDYMAQARQDAARAFERIAAAAAAHDMRCETLIAEHAQAASGIVEAAETTGADLIVMGSHGRGGVIKFVLGSVASKVLELSPVPVMIIKS